MRRLLCELVALIVGVSSFALQGSVARSTTLYAEPVQVKFRIHPDGRIEETVLGIKGTDCEKVTEALNEKLGSIISSAPTEERFEEKVEDTNNVYETKFTEW
ncbi:hypothetical protein CTAYLR_004467 [Chrysophaeum taylorii]|uniref:DUF2997 domain-containing protein n=1 Tax=Chrysophaeum taylorii TaxID=2483200 RepID=A0AAD7UCJ0_9STRA|nr:hypothetical protein CTAYLR_004467 [Chrysophaeum taylorii]